MNYIEQAVVGPARTYRQKMRRCYPEQNQVTYNQGPIGRIVVGEDHDTVLLIGILEPLWIASWKCPGGPQIPVRLFSSRTVHGKRVSRGWAG